MSLNYSQLPLIRTLHRLRGAFWRRRVLRWLIRAVWLALLVPTVVMGGYLGLNWQISWKVWLLLMVLIGLLSLLWSMRPINLKKMTRRLDDLLSKRAQLITALEVGDIITHTDNPVVEELVQNTVNLTVNLRRQVNLLGQGFWLEMHALVAVAAILGAMLVFDALTTNIPHVLPVELPVAGQEPSAESVVPPPPSLQPEVVPQDTEALSKTQLRSALQVLADALRDHSVSHPIAEQIDQGDISGAATEVRRLVDRLDGLSDQALGELSNNLQEAADNIGEGIPGLTDPLERGHQALDNQNLPAAGQALEELAETLDNISETLPESRQPEASDESEEINKMEQPEPENQESGNSTGEEESVAQPLEEEAERLPIDGQPLELESDPNIEERVLQPSELDVQASARHTSDSPFARQPLNASGDDLGPDPLAYPWEKRDVIRQYFTP